MKTDVSLRKEVKLLKALHNVTYKSISSQLDIKQKSFYGWLKGDFDLSPDNKRLLQVILNKYVKE